MIGIYSVGMGTGASLSAGLTIPLQHVLKGSLEYGTRFLGCTNYYRYYVLVSCYETKKKTSTQNKKE